MAGYHGTSAEKGAARLLQNAHKRCAATGTELCSNAHRQAFFAKKKVQNFPQSGKL